MSVTTPPTLTAPPSTPPSSSDSANFDARADSLLGWLPTLISDMTDALANVFANATDAYNSAVAALGYKNAADSAASAAAANASNSAAYAGATAWVSGETYAVGDKRWSLINGRVHVRRTVGAGTVDPMNDPTNWEDVIFGARIRITSNTNLVVGKLYELDSSGGAFTVTLPASFSNKDRIGLRDYGMVLSTNPVTVARNGSNIRRTAEDLVLDVVGDSLDLVGDTTLGWIEE